jgi:predicted ATP-dependent endonuclease of OLD family
MKLSSVIVSEFQSIRNSNRFDIDDITCLVGKNEAGKTAILRALYRLNPMIPAHSNFDVTDDYPRAEVEDYQQDVEAHRRSPAIVIEATFTLDSEEVNSIESEFGSGILEKPEMTLRKGYENKLDIQLYVDEKVAVKAIIDSANLPAALSQEFSDSSNIEALGTLINSKVDPESTDKINQIKSQLSKISQGRGLTPYIYEKYLSKSTPKFLYFDECYVMTGQENIEALKTRVSQNKLLEPDYPLLGLIELARLNLDQLLNPTRTEWLINKLEGASNHLSGKVLKYWSQNKHLHMTFEVRAACPGDPQGMTSGTNIWARILDSKRKVSTPLGTRSRGFVWFFSFLAWFDQQQRKNEPLILLLDEPGLFLHGTAQADLLRYIDEELKGNLQVIYTTHSPFMVDPAKFSRVRIVQDKSMDSDQAIPKDEDGTKVITEVLEATQDSLFPLQGALGYEIYQTLFVGQNNLVVEGVSDLIYLQTISALLDSHSREKLNDKWTITPVGGADKVPTFIALLGAQKGLKIATLIDLQKKDQQSIDNLYKKKLLKKQNLLTFADFTASSEADIEDMFDIDFYLKLVNGEYGSYLDTPIKPDMLTLKAPRVLLRLERFFSTRPLKSSTQFNHYRPARYFAENIATLSAALPPIVLDRFEIAFKALNALL